MQVMLEVAAWVVAAVLGLVLGGSLSGIVHF